MSYIGLILLIVFSVVDPGEGPGGGGRLPPLFLDQTEARRAEKSFFDGSGLGLMTFHKMSPRTHHNYL